MLDSTRAIDGTAMRSSQKPILLHERYFAPLSSLLLNLSVFEIFYSIAERKPLDAPTWSILPPFILVYQ